MFPGFAPLDWYLQENGQRTVGKLIRKERRENVEWWVKVLSPILSLIVGILGLLVAGMTVWFAWSKKAM
jgi:multisubunit Na+/H+ antiporter MnhB subunit